MAEKDFLYSPSTGESSVKTPEIPEFTELPHSLQVAFRNIFDYTGHADPSNPSPQRVLDNYLHYHCGDQKQMLGKLVVPTGDLHTIQTNPLDPEDWHISALFAADTIVRYAKLERGMSSVMRVNSRSYDVMSPNIEVNTLEMKVRSAEEVKKVVDMLHDFGREADVFVEEFLLFLEVPNNDRMIPTLEAMKQLPLKDINPRPKLRTGGPDGATTEQIANFMQQAQQLGLPYKFTGGFNEGYLNAIMASAFSMLFKNDPPFGTPFIIGVLEEKDPNAFTISDDEIVWKDIHISRQLIAHARQRQLQAISTYSFDEPVAALATLSTR